MHWIYLDNNATTQPAAEVVAVMHEVQRELWANPSSVHRFGQMVRQRVELARASVANLIGARDRDIVFTSGGTESNNLAIKGSLAMAAPAAPGVLITNKVEHSAVREPAADAAKSGMRVEYVPVDRDGYVAAEAVDEVLKRVASGGPATVVVSVQWANNETGVIQPVAAIARVIQAAQERGEGTGSSRAHLWRFVFHVDATQAVGKIPLNIKSLDTELSGGTIDLLTLSAHKFHGPKGVGALYIRGGTRLKPQQLGGPHERERRGGTENAAGIIGMGIAAELAMKFLSDGAAIERLRALRDRFERSIVAALPDTVINSAGRERLWNTTNLGFPRLEAEAILLGLSERGVCASAGAACSSGSLDPSPVLLAMGIPEPVAHGSVRFSISRFTTGEEIDAGAKAVVEVVERLRKTMPMGV